ncbi:MAG: hypothetical protein AAGA76_13400 [Pseudomonadota bacterium]
MPYTSLNPDKIISTAEQLEKRISERFPNASLVGVACELKDLASVTKAQSEKLEQPIHWVRLATAASVFSGIIVFFFIGRFLTFDRIDTGAFNFVQGVEAVINAMVLIGLGLIAIAKSEERIKRKQVLGGLHSLRSLIHIIDMHQLTKDPVMTRGNFKPTASSPKRTLKPAELIRYLDYCSEMLSITGKIAALYAQAVPDTEVVDAVNDVETLGANLSRKIWQKIMLIDPEKAPARRKAPVRKRRLQPVS